MMNMLSWRKDLHLSRSREIAGVLVGHGWDSLLENFGLFHPAKSLNQKASHGGSQTGPEHLRSALEELGTTFIKLGQILSTRADLLPPDYLTELTKLQDSAAPVPFEAVRDTLVSELKQPLESAFLSFDPEPLAAASIGLAHAATLPDGTEVVVKVRRPGVVEQVHEDLEILKELATAAGRHWEFADRYDLVGIVEEFSETLKAELDYIREGHNAERFAGDFANEAGIHIPKVYWETTTSRVLTLERIRGTKINDLVSLDEQGINRSALAGFATGVVMRMVCENGFFHADPHPGNFFIEPDGTIALIDFGMVGVLDERVQEHLADLLININHQDAEGLVDVFLYLGVSGKHVARDLLRRDIEHLLSTYWGLPLNELRISAVLSDVFAVMRRHQLHLPSNLALLLKTVVMIEGLGLNLDPEFHLTSALEPYADRLVMRKYSPTKLVRNLGRASLDLARLGAEMPQHLRRIVSAAENGNLQIGMRPEGFDPVIRRVERIANRIVLGVLAAAFINGLAVLASVYRPPGWESWAWVVFAFGFICALTLGLYLALSILRSRHG
ncbi:MAG: AarF/ABC1/UbiB kinase family protein [Pyrinomonadaceae bacterium]|nr:AarF/ABC1/UbiB kinase family protein [Pyrinomonadaceae bacterium]